MRAMITSVLCLFVLTRGAAWATNLNTASCASRLDGELKIVLKQISTSNLPPSGQISAELIYRIFSAGRLVREDQIEAAIKLLDGFTPPPGSQIRVEPRQLMRTTHLSAPDERTFQKNVLQSLAQRPKMARVEDGLVYSIPRPPDTTEEGERLTWLRRIWIRIAAEELGHLAQCLSTLQHGSVVFLSRVSTSPQVANRLFPEAERLVAKGQEVMFTHLVEADVYAMMIDQFGLEFIPSWMGQESYPIRKVIDEYHVTRGALNRLKSTVRPAPKRD